MKALRIALLLAAIALLVAGTRALLQATLLLEAATATVAAVPGELAATRQALGTQVEAARQDVLVRSERQIAALRHEVIGQLAEIRQTADRRIGDSLAQVGTAIKAADVRLGEVTALRGDLRPLLSESHALLASADVTVRDLRPQLLGLVAASKVTAGETAQTMRDVRRATPMFLSTWQSIGVHADAMSAAGERSFLATQHTMENFSAASKPLPRWARIVLNVGPPVAQAGAAAVGAGAALGWFGRK